MLSRSSRVVVIAKIELAVDRVDRGGAYHSRAVMIYDHVRSRGATRVRPKSGNKRVQKHRRRSRDACMQANPRQGTGSRQGSGLEMNRRGIRNLGLATDQRGLLAPRHQTATVGFHISVIPLRHTGAVHGAPACAAHGGMPNLTWRLVWTEAPDA